MAFKHLRNLFFLTIIGGIPIIAFAQEDFSAGLLPPASGDAYSVRETLKIGLQKNLDIEVLTLLVVEVDGIDVTAFLSFDGENFSYTPIEALVVGSHVVKLIQRTSEGDMQQRGQWQFSVKDHSTSAVSQSDELAAAEAWLKNTDFSADTTTEIINRSSNNSSVNSYVVNTPKRTIISGAGNMRTALTGGDNFTLSARANYLLQSDRNFTRNGRTMDLGEYDIAAHYAGDIVHSDIRIGHHGIGVESLLMSSYNRRGMSARMGMANGRAEGVAFSFHPEPISGINDFSGVNDLDNRLDGVSSSFQPFSSTPYALKVTALSFSGYSSNQNISQNNAAVSNTAGFDFSGFGGAGFENMGTSSSGWAAIAEKGFAQGRFTLRGEYASALFDSDDGASGGISGFDQDTEEERSDAVSLRFQAQPFKAPVLLDKSVSFFVGAKYERIGTFFASLANRGLAADRDAVSVYSYFYWGALSANLQLLDETNNVDGLISVPTDRMRSVSLNTSYYFDKQQGGRSWLGTPYLNVSAMQASNNRIKSPVDYPFDTNNESSSIMLSLGSNYQQTSWSFSQTFSNYDDNANNSHDTANGLTGLTVSWAGERVNFSGGVQHDSFRDKDIDSAVYNTTINLSISAVLLADKLNFRMNYNLNLAGGSGDFPDRKVINGEIGWTIFAAKTNRPGLVFAIGGSMESVDGNPMFDTTSHQSFAILRMQAPFLF